MIKILLLIDYSSEFDRKLLRGLVQYSKENGPWLFYRLPSYYSAMHGEQGILKWAKEWKADAIIGQWNNDTIDLQKELNIPVVLQNYHHRSVTYSNLTGGYKGTGRMAAQFFAKRMFRNFAYFGVKGVVWSDERCEGYRQEVKRIGGEFFSFESDKQEDEIRMEVSQWLQQLPKPVALFCCDDAHALFISETCRMNNIHIPEEIALLGVDNDELMCNISDPPISSIELEVERGGYSIGRLIHQQIKKEHGGTFNIVINPIRIELRQSTEKHNIKDPYILEFLGIPEQTDFSETELESRLIDHLQEFLLELGTGFAFVARQKRFTFEEDHFRVDLVFYNRLLQCFVLFDLKTEKLKHQDLGQMQMYVNYYDRYEKTDFENPTIGILLCPQKNDAVVELTLPENSNIFPSQYQLYLPDKKLLQKKLQEWIEEETGGEDD
mgnify:CR=1 FL=1